MQLVILSRQISQFRGLKDEEEVLWVVETSVLAWDFVDWLHGRVPGSFLAWQRRT
jgi:hypothetical protein